uniref:SAP domain-containing protein n=2 Tax=Sphenodon punctatus TaxID=8508 RepID=A0A8D0L176_SPHPU
MATGPSSAERFRRGTETAESPLPGWAKHGSRPPTDRESDWKYSKAERKHPRGDFRVGDRWPNPFRKYTSVAEGRSEASGGFPEVADSFRSLPDEGGGQAAAPHKMADGEEVTLDGRPLQALRVADLKAALEQRGLAKSGQKSALIKRLRGALMLENLQKHSTPHTTFQPNSQIGEEMSQNSFIKQYLEKQQELLRQRLEREAREAADTEGKSCFMSRDQEDSDEERARRQERRSTRVRQARTTKTLESLQSVGKEELEAQHRGRRSTPRVAIKPEDDDEEEEEEEDDDEEEEEEEEEDEEEESPSVLARRVLERKGLSGIPVPQKEQAAPEPQPAEERAADTRGPETALPLASQPQAGPQPGEAGQTTSSQPGDKREPAPRLKEEERETGALGAPEVKDADQEPEAPWEVEEPGPPKEEAAPGILKEERAELQEEGVFGPPEPQEERGAGHKLLKDKAADQAPQLQEVGVTEVPEPREKGEAQADEDPEQAVEAPGTLEKATAAAALTQGSPSPPELMEAQCPQQAPSGDEPPPPLLTKEAPPSPAPRVDEAPPQLSRTSPPTQEPPPAATAKPIVRETEPRRLPSPLPRRRPRGRSSSSRSSSSSNSSSSRSRDSSGSRSRKRRSRSGSSESPARKRRASGSHSGSDRPKRSRSRSWSGSRSSSDSSRKSHSPESSRDSSNFPRTKEPSAPGELAPHSSPQAQQEAPPTPKTEKRMAPSLPPAPQRRPSHTHQHGASTEPQRPALQRGNSDPPVPSEAAASAVEGPGGEPQPPAERRHSNA